VTALAQAQAASQAVRVLVVGDSVSASLAYQPSTELAVAKGFNVTFDLRVCRRLASAGCPYKGRTPSSALEVVESSASGSDVLVVDVGYNDDPTLYGSQMAEVIRAAQALGVSRSSGSIFARRSPSTSGQTQ
jgi:hypothetical protein